MSTDRCRFPVSALHPLPGKSSSFQVTPSRHCLLLLIRLHALHGPPQDGCSQKLGTDSMLLGAWAEPLLPLPLSRESFPQPSMGSAVFTASPAISRAEPPPSSASSETLMGGASSSHVLDIGTGSGADLPPSPSGAVLYSGGSSHVLDIGTGSGVLALMMAQKASGVHPGSGVAQTLALPAHTAKGFFRQGFGGGALVIDAIDVHLPSCLQVWGGGPFPLRALYHLIRPVVSSPQGSCLPYSTHLS